MKNLFMLAMLAFLFSCNSSESASSNLDDGIYGHDWYYSNALRHVQAGITTGNNYDLVFNKSSNTATLTIDSSTVITYSLTTTGSNTFDALNQTTSVTTHWTYTVNSTARTLYLCLDATSCVTLTR